MAQKRFWNWKDDDSTMALSNWMRSFLGYGIYYGFDANFAASVGMTFVMDGAITGTRYVNQALTLITDISVVMTKQGVTIQESSAVSVPVSPGHGLYDRIDTVVVEHQFQEIVGGSSAIYLIVEGTPSATPIPTPVTSTKQTILGYLKIPSNCTNISTNPNVTWTKESVASFDNDQTIVRTNKDQIVTSPKTFNFQRGTINSTSYVGADLQLALGNFHTIPYSGSARKVINRIIGPINTHSAGSWVYIFTKQNLILTSTDNGGRFVTSVGTQDAGTGKNIYIDAGEGFFVLSDGVIVSGTASYEVMKGGEAGKNNGPRFMSMIRNNKGPDRAIGVDGEIDMEIFAGGGNFFEITGGTATLRQVKSCSSYDNGGTVGEEYDTGGTVIRVRNSAGSSFVIQSGYGTPNAKYKPIITPNGLNISFEVGAIIELMEDELGWRLTGYVSSTANPFGKYMDDLLDVTISFPQAGDTVVFVGTQFINLNLENIIANTERTFGKVQSLGLGSVSSGNINTSTGVITVTGNGNNYEINLPAATVNITNVVKTGAVAFPSGAVINLTFVGAGGAGPWNISTGPSGTNIQSYRSGNGANVFPFQFNDTIEMIMLSNGKWRIISMNGELVRRIDTNIANIATVTADELNHNPNRLITKVVDIGPWNMDSVPSLGIAHGVADFKKIVSIDVMIIDDALSFLRRLEGSANGVGPLGKSMGAAAINSTNILMYRLDNASDGLFDDNTNYSSTAASRGKITIVYLP